MRGASASLPLALASLVAVPAAHAQLTVDADTVALWHLDDGSGLFAADDGISGLTLALERWPADGSAGNDVPTWQENGCFDGALHFAKGNADGDGGYLATQQGHAFAANELTVELWLRTTSDTGILFWGGFVQLQVWLAFDGKVRVQVGDGMDWSESAITADPVNDGAWHYLVARYDGSEVAVFVDGAESGTAAYAGTLGTLTGFFVGGRPFNTFYEGMLDEVRLSDVARDDAAIEASWNALAVLCPEPGAGWLSAGAGLALLALRPPRGPRPAL